MARYKRVSRKNLPRNITVKKVRKIGPRQQRTQKGGFAKGVFRKGVLVEKH